MLNFKHGVLSGDSEELVPVCLHLRRSAFEQEMVTMFFAFMVLFLICAGSCLKLQFCPLESLEDCPPIDCSRFGFLSLLLFLDR